MNSHALCAPSQNGFRAEWPQRQSETFGLSLFRAISLPSWSTSEKSPVTSSDPFLRTLISTRLGVIGSTAAGMFAAVTRATSRPASS